MYATPHAAAPLRPHLAGGTPVGVPPRRIPLAVKVVYTAFIAVLVPAYLHTYGPANFLYYCDFAALVTCVGLWTGRPLLLGTQAVAILVPQVVWVVDFTVTLLGGRLLNMTAYMFDPSLSLFVRALSTFHGWMPFFLVWAVRRVGYDRRSFRVQLPVGLAVLVICYATLTPVRNVNYVFGPGSGVEQHWMPPLAWLGVVMAVAVGGMFVPAHLLLRRFIAPPPTEPA